MDALEHVADFVFGTDENSPTFRLSFSADFPIKFSFETKDTVLEEWCKFMNQRYSGKPEGYEEAFPKMYSLCVQKYLELTVSWAKMEFFWSWS